MHGHGINRAPGRAGQPASSNCSTATYVSISAGVRRRGRKKKEWDACQVIGCNADLKTSQCGKQYCSWLGICGSCLKAEMVRMPGHQHRVRFYFQCGKLHPLSAFNGLKRNYEASLRKRSQAAQSKKEKQRGTVNAGSNTVGSSHAQAAPTGLLAGAAAAAPVHHPGRQQQQQQQALWELLYPLNDAALLDDSILLQDEGSEVLFYELGQRVQQQQHPAVDPGLASLLTAWLSDDLDECTTSCPGAALLAPAAHVPSSSAAALAAAAEATDGTVAAAALPVTLPHSPMSSTSDATGTLAAAAEAAAGVFPCLASPSSSAAGFCSQQLIGFSAFGLHQQHPQQGLQAQQLQHLQQLELQALNWKHYMQKMLLQQQPDTGHAARGSCTGGPMDGLLMPEYVALPPPQQQQQQVLLPLPSTQLTAAVNAAGQVLHSYHAYPQLPGLAAGSYYNHADIQTSMPANTRLGAGHMQMMQGSLAAAIGQLCAAVLPSGGAAYEIDRQNSSSVTSQMNSPGRWPARGQLQQAGASAAEWFPAALP